MDRVRGIRLVVVWSALVLAGGCGGPEPGAEPGVATTEGESTPIRVVDDAGRAIELSVPARRIVSLVPSVTGTIVALGSADRLVARTRYDLDPALAELPSLGGGLDPSVEGIIDLRPDLVIAWNARDDRVLVPRLTAAGIPVYAAEVQDTTAVFATFDRIGLLLGRKAAADSVAGVLRDTLAAVAADVPAGARPSALYLIAEDTPRIAGPSTFVAQAIAVAGAEHAFPEVAEDWPTISLEALIERDPDVIVLPVGPGLPGRGALSSRAGWRDLQAVRAGRVVEIDADLMARPGPDLGRAARVIRQGLSAVATP